jgi:malonyl CoA-acyl carrier protein transacylase
VAFLFTGQGSHYLNMGADLRASYPEVSACFDRADELLANELPKPLSSYVFVDGESDEAFRALSQTEVTQPAVLTMDAALMRILAGYGIAPDVVAGHSLGEYGACFAAG